MTYRKAIEAGYKNGDTAYQRGYVSRRANIDDQPVLTAGGNRRGELYVLIPSFVSSQYCVRQYLTK